MITQERQQRQTFAVVLVLVVAAVLGVTAYTLWRLRADAVATGIEVSIMHTRSFENFLTQSLLVTELVAGNTTPLKNGKLDLPSMENSFVNTLRHSPFLRSISMLDEGGRIVASSNAANVGVIVITQNYLPPISGSRDILRLGQPWAGRDFSGGRPSTAQTPVDAQAQSFIPVTRTLTVNERSVTLLFALNPDYFLNHIAQQLDARAGAVEVLRYDGTLLMATDAGALAGSVRDYVVRDLRLAEVESGQFEQDLGHDRHALTAYRASRLYPFVVITLIDREYALRPWQSEAKTMLGIVIPALLVISLLAIAFYRRQLQLAAQRVESERLQRINATVFDASTEAILITDLDTNIISVNRAFTRITGFESEEVVGHPLIELFTPGGSATVAEKMQQQPSDYAPIEVQLRCKDGSLTWTEILSSPGFDAHGAIVGYHRISRNINERKQMQDQVRQLAFYDALTELPNRRLLSDRLNQTLAAGKRSGRCGALMFLDLDNFKPLNDRHGHGVGDLLLMEVARRLTRCVREIDSVARFGGDEFVVLLSELFADKTESTEQSRIVAEKIRLTLAEPYLLSIQPRGQAQTTLEHHCTASIGVVVFISHESSQDDILEWADAAMYQAKENGRNLIRFHVPQA